MKKILTYLLLAGSFFSLAGECFAARMVVEGSTTVLPIAQRAAEEYMNAHSEADISVRGGGSGVGITSLIEGTCDIASASRAIKEDELQKAAARGRAPKANVIAMDGIAVIVNNANSVSELSKKQLKDIFVGKITDWVQVGGPSGRIVVVSRDSASGTFEAFGELALDKAKVRKDALMQSSNQAVASVVSKTPGAIGYVGLAYLNGVKALKIDGVKPSKETVLSKQYKLSRPLFMYTNGKPAGLAREYLDFIQSPAGQKLVEEEGCVSIR